MTTFHAVRLAGIRHLQARALRIADTNRRSRALALLRKVEARLTIRDCATGNAMMIEQVNDLIAADERSA